MSNKYRGEVEIFLDKKRTLKYNHNALVRLEKELGHSLTKLDSEDISITKIATMFWAGLLHEMKELTLEDAIELMDYSNIGEISEKITEAFSYTFDQKAPKTSKKK
jgi:hypothetical protein